MILIKHNTMKCSEQGGAMFDGISDCNELKKVWKLGYVNAMQLRVKGAGQNFLIRFKRFVSFQQPAHFLRHTSPLW